MIIRNESGYCKYAFEEDDIGSYVHIFDLYVYPEFRGKGISKTLLNKAIKEITDTGYSGEIKIVACPREESISLKKLQSFYSSLGLAVYENYQKVASSL